jgi:hypothetical protein
MVDAAQGAGKYMAPRSCEAPGEPAWWDGSGRYVPFAGHCAPVNGNAAMNHRPGESLSMTDLKEREGSSETLRKLLSTFTLEERLAGLTPEERRAALRLAVRRAGLAPADLLAGLTLEERLAGLTPEERRATLRLALRRAGFAPEDLLAGLAPEERLAGLAPEEQILALSDEVLRGFPEDYVRSLPAHVQQVIRERQGKSR